MTSSFWAILNIHSNKTLSPQSNRHRYHFIHQLDSTSQPSEDMVIKVKVKIGGIVIITITVTTGLALKSFNRLQDTSEARGVGDALRMYCENAAAEGRALDKESLLQELKDVAAREGAVLEEDYS
ncbi:hypothetical protein BHE90_004470 [Fusarium euwallaceae]|uniref:Uncharacterized protein n=1 Tax=Fusarium euwallaceae TaxID=1147111 RepID=A0A430LZ71_9HYPO|nr:hypothetical protein BHE90_004470 [Fusarium euwallaceae]